jgi:hypothetical protein
VTLVKSHGNKAGALSKILSVTRALATVGVFVLAALQLLRVWDEAINLAIPLLGIVLLIQSAQVWKRQRGAAICSLCSALFIFGCAIAGRLA